MKGCRRQKCYAVPASSLWGLETITRCGGEGEWPIFGLSSMFADGEGVVGFGEVGYRMKRNRGDRTRYRKEVEFVVSRVWIRYGWVL